MLDARPSADVEMPSVELASRGHAMMGPPNPHFDVATPETVDDEDFCLRLEGRWPA
jgi:hypothetical protein